MADNATTPPDSEAAQAVSALAEIPDRLCAWCKVVMMKRLVGGGVYIHYTCPTCIFQHTAKREPSGDPPQRVDPRKPAQ